MHADADKQGLVQGMITGMRGLCNGLGPAMFGLVFSLFHVNLNEKDLKDAEITPEPPGNLGLVTELIPGPPFVFGALLVILALMVSAFIPESMSQPLTLDSPTSTMALRRNLEKKLSLQDYKKSDDDDDELYNEHDGTTVPLIHATSSSAAVL